MPPSPSRRRTSKRRPPTESAGLASSAPVPTCVRMSEIEAGDRSPSAGYARSVQRLLRVVALAATLWSAAAPVVAVASTRAEVVDVREAEGGDRSEAPRTAHEATQPSIARTRIEAPAPTATTDDIVLVPDRW